MQETSNAFGGHLRELRTRRRLKQVQLDEAVGRGASYTAHVEAGNLAPPDREACSKLAVVLGVDADELWRAAAYARLERADPDALATVLAETGSAQKEPKLTPDERRLVLALRRVDEAGGRRSPTASSLLRLTNLVLTRERAKSGPDPQALAQALDRIDELGHVAARAALDMVVSLGSLLGAEAARAGVVPDGPPAPRSRRPPAR